MQSQFNPYSAPVAEDSPIDEVDQPLPASLGQRFVNMLVDSLVAAVLGMVAGILVQALGRPVDEWAMRLLVYGGLFLYFTLCEGFTGRPLGKLVTGTKVVDFDGRPPGLVAAAGRSLCRFIPFEPLSVLFRDGEGWHDTIPKTRVVRAR